LKFFPERSQKSEVRSQKSGARGHGPVRNGRWKWFAAIVAACSVLGLRAELTHWAENIEAASKLEAVFFRTVALPGGAVVVRRPPKETRPELGKLITAAPQDAEL
jgi:hypothetical protein